jgi:hypothetical protein
VCLDDQHLGIKTKTKMKDHHLSFIFVFGFVWCLDDQHLGIFFGDQFVAGEGDDTEDKS